MHSFVIAPFFIYLEAVVGGTTPYYITSCHGLIPSHFFMVECHSKNFSVTMSRNSQAKYQDNGHTTHTSFGTQIHLMDV